MNQIARKKSFTPKDLGARDSCDKHRNEGARLASTRPILRSHGVAHTLFLLAPPASTPPDWPRWWPPARRRSEPTLRRE